MPVVFDEKYLPATLTAAPMSDEEFIEFCAGYPDYFIEVTSEGEILIMPPTHWLTGARGARILFQLQAWAIAGDNGIVTDAASGFFLPDGSRRSPDAAWISRDQIATVDFADRTGSWHICPAFVIELKSPSDRIGTLRKKMAEWIRNGAQRGWLIDPDRRAVEIYRRGCAPEIRTALSQIEGEGPVDGFVLDLQPVWDPIRR
jgi:Uma2 family endonuclease